MHDPGPGDVAGRELTALVEYADGESASAFAQVLGGLIEANVGARPERRRDFDSLQARVGIAVTDIDEAVTLEFQGGRLLVDGAAVDLILEQLGPLGRERGYGHRQPPVHILGWRARCSRPAQRSIDARASRGPGGS